MKKANKIDNNQLCPKVDVCIDYSNRVETLANKETELFDADPNCVHDIEELSSGIKCKKCNGWFCF